MAKRPDQARRNERERARYAADPLRRARVKAKSKARREADADLRERAARYAESPLALQMEELAVLLAATKRK